MFVSFIKYVDDIGGLGGVLPHCRFYNFFATFLHSTTKNWAIFYIYKTLQNSTSTILNGKIYNCKILIFFNIFNKILLFSTFYMHFMTTEVMLRVKK